MTPPTDIILVDAAAAIYAPQPGDFDHLIQVNPMAPYIGVKHCDGYDLVAARGSVSIDDWWRDLRSEAACAVAGYHQFGFLPYGFARHLADTYAAVKAVLSAVPLYGSGHSLGAPEVLYLCAAHVLAGGIVGGVALFESPNPGTAMLTASTAQIAIDSYRNIDDPVPDCPFPVKPLLPWEPSRAAKVFDIGPAPTPLHPLARHNIALCQQGVRALAVSG